jgi:tetratricopeptide (TPR) repeat protein
MLKVNTKAVAAKETKLIADLVESPQSKNKYKSLQN